MFSPPDETMLCSERKMKVVHVQVDKNKAIILRQIIFQPSKFSTNLVLSLGGHHHHHHLFAFILQQSKKEN